MTELVTPAERYRASYFAAKAEDAHAARITDEQFAALLARFADYAAGRDLKPGHVAETTLWFVDGDDYIGRISLRHALTPLLRAIGGHVGYDVRPSRRRQGHATRMLELAKPRLAALGIDPALITCDDTNVASRKVIEACGGVPATEHVPLDDVLRDADDELKALLAAPQLRFWLPTQ